MAPVTTALALSPASPYRPVTQPVRAGNRADGGRHLIERIRVLAGQLVGAGRGQLAEGGGWHLTSCVTEHGHAAEPGLDPPDGRRQRGVVGQGNEFVAHLRASAAQPLEAGDRGLVVIGVLAADDRYGRARAGEHLRQRQPGRGRAPADQYDVLGSQREVAAAQRMHRAHHRLSDGAVLADRELPVGTRSRGRDPLRRGQSIGRQRRPDDGDAHRWMLGVQGRPEPRG
jgi:hypothetical protein